MAEFYEVGLFIVLYSGFVVSALVITVTEQAPKTHGAENAPRGQGVATYKKPRGRKDSNLEVA